MEVSVFVDGQKLREYLHMGSTYIAVDLYSKQAYVVEEVDDSMVDGDVDAHHTRGIECGKEPPWQRYTLNPFMIKVEKMCACPVFLKVKLDGEVIQCRPMGRGRRTLTVDRIKHQGTLRELVFSLPRLTAKSVVPEARKEQVGTVEVEMEEAEEGGRCHMPATSVQWEPRAMLPPQPAFPQASKGDVRNLQSQGSRTIVARDGRMVGRLVRNLKHRVCKMQYRRTGRIVAQKLLLYRSILVLQEMGILPPPPPVPNNPPGPGSGREEGKPACKKKEVDFKLDDFPPNHYMTEDPKTDKPSTGCTLEEDGKMGDNKADNIADEVMKTEDTLLEDSVIFVRYESPAVKRERAPSVVCMGDQDCFVVDKDLTVIQINSDMEMEEDLTD